MSITPERFTIWRQQIQELARQTPVYDGSVHKAKGTNKLTPCIPSHVYANTVCELCDGAVKYPRRIVWHHWYDNTTGKLCGAFACGWCNTKLTSAVFGISENHVLPSLDVQRYYIKCLLDMKPIHLISPGRYPVCSICDQYIDIRQAYYKIGNVYQCGDCIAQGEDSEDK